MLTITLADVQAVAANLPGDWTVTQEYPTSAQLVRTHDGLRLSMIVRNNKVKVLLTGIPQEHLRYNESRPSINVTLTPARSRSVAKDITRRLLPGAEALNAIVAERIAAHNEYETSRGSLADLLGLETNDHGSARINEGAVWGDATVYASDVTMSLHNLSPQQAKAILAIVRTA